MSVCYGKAVINTSVAAFLCPSDPGGSVFKQGTNSGASVGPQFRFEFGGTTGVGVGLFAAVYASGIRDILDGTSNTVAFNEVLIGDNSAATQNGAEKYTGLAWPDGKASGNGAGETQTMPTGANFLVQYITSCDQRRRSRTNELNAAKQRWISSRVYHGSFTNHLLPPNSAHADCFFYEGNAGMSTARSRHPVGVNSLFADGSVHFLKASINPSVWWGLGSKAGGEAISVDSY